MPKLRKNERITKRLQAHAILMANYRDDGMAADEASRKAYYAVMGMNDGALCLVASIRTQ